MIISVKMFEESCSTMSVTLVSILYGDMKRNDGFGRGEVEDPMSAAAHSTTAMANEFSLALGIIILSVCYTDLFSNYITYNYM